MFKLIKYVRLRFYVLEEEEKKYWTVDSCLYKVEID